MALERQPRRRWKVQSRQSTTTLAMPGCSVLSTSTSTTETGTVGSPYLPSAACAQYWRAM
jgi:hypothetical protein